MKLKELGNVLFGSVLLGFGMYVLGSDRVLGRGGFTQMTKETHPLVFWLQVIALSGAGIFFVAYGVAKTFKLATKITDVIDNAADSLLSRGASSKNKSNGDAPSP